MEINCTVEPSLSVSLPWLRVSEAAALSKCQHREKFASRLANIDCYQMPFLTNVIFIKMSPSKVQNVY
jgi:hypothetical protein